MKINAMSERDGGGDTGLSRYIIAYCTRRSGAAQTELNRSRVIYNAERVKIEVTIRILSHRIKARININHSGQKKS